MATLADFVSQRYPGVFSVSVPYIRKTVCEDDDKYSPCSGNFVTTSDNAVLESWPKYVERLESIVLSDEMYAKVIIPTKISDRCIVKYDEHVPFEAGRKAMKCGRNYDIPDDLDFENYLANKLPSFDANKAVLVDGKFTVCTADPDEYMPKEEKKYYEKADKAQMQTFMDVMEKVYNTIELLHENKLYINNLSEHYIYVSENNDVLITNLTELSGIPQLMLEETCLIALYCSQINDFTLLDEMYKVSPVWKNKDMMNFEIQPPAEAGIIEPEQEGGSTSNLSMFALFGVITVMSVLGSI